MTCDKIAPPIDMDQEVELRVVVTVSRQYDYGTEQSLSQTIAAPLYITKDVKVAAIAETLCQRAIQRFMGALREKKLEEIRREGVQRAKEIEDAATKGDWTEEDDQDT